MSARDFVIRGLHAGLLAGIATFLVAYVVGEPQIEAAITLEEAGAAGEAPAADDGHEHGEGPRGTRTVTSKVPWSLARLRARGVC